MSKKLAFLVWLSAPVPVFAERNDAGPWWLGADSRAKAPPKRWPCWSPWRNLGSAAQSNNPPADLKSALGLLHAGDSGVAQFV